MWDVVNNGTCTPCTRVQKIWKPRNIWEHFSLAKCFLCPTLTIFHVYSQSVQRLKNKTLYMPKWARRKKHTILIMIILPTLRKEKLLLSLLDLLEENILYIDTGWWIGSLYLSNHCKISNICKIMFHILGLLMNKHNRIHEYVYRVCGRKMLNIWKMRRKEMLWNIKRPDPIRLKRNKDRLHNLLCRRI